MATTCSFGRIKDVRLVELCIGSRLVINKSRDVDSRNIVAKSLNTRQNLTVNGDGTICGNLNVKGQIIGNIQGGGIIPGDGKTEFQDLLVTGNLFSSDVEFTDLVTFSGNVTSNGNVTVLGSMEIPPISGPFLPHTVNVLMCPCLGNIGGVNAMTGNVTYTPNQSRGGMDAYVYSIQDTCGLVRKVTQFVCRASNL